MAVDMFLKIKGIQGESKDDKHKDEIDVLSWSWGETQTGTFAAGGGGGAGKVAMQDFHFVMKVNKASPKLLQACATGSHIGDVTLVCRKAGGKEGQEFIKVVFADCLVSSYQTGASSGGDEIPTEQISLNFAEIKYDYRAQKADGTLDGPVSAGYNIQKNKAT
jgi:type VI secretion system secreted protein Hcp